LIDEIRTILQNRKPITYTPIDLFLWAISCMYLFCFKVCLKRIPFINRQAYFRVGAGKIREELDAV